MTSARLWWVLLIASILGTLLPLYAIVQKSANAKTTVERVLGGSDSWSRLIEEPIFGVLVGLGERLGKNDWTWHNPRTRGHSRYYLRYAIMNALFAIVLIAFRARWRRLGNRVLTWMRKPDHRGPRRFIVGLGIFMILTYQLKIMSGVWFPGIAGWTYDNDNWRAALVTERPDAPTDDPDDVDSLGPAERWHVPSPDEHAMLAHAILDQNLTYLPQAGWLDGDAMLLHYADGTVRAASLELTDIVFPQYIYGNPRRPDKRTDTAHLVRAVRRTLAERRAGRQMFMPLRLAYPVHCNFMKLPYETYPDPAMLTAISFWELVVHVDPAGTFAIEHARRTNLIECDADTDSETVAARAEEAAHG